MADDNTELEFTGLQRLDPQAQIAAVQQLGQAVISRRRWAIISNAVFVVCATACFCTTCVVCYGGAP